LARWDAILLSHATGHRDRIISPHHRAAVYTKNGDVRPTFIVNGFVAGTWDLAESGEAATLMLRPFGKLSSAERRELEAEGMLLAAFVRPAADSHAVEWAGRE
ncbi:MAG: winged helix DNA-binding domain-containing protein, partial [Chloroflexota bacterium]|nr:winged helix DNA-binding domain-containing protein [Chloroflexota bacterium]